MQVPATCKTAHLYPRLKTTFQKDPSSQEPYTEFDKVQAQ